MLSTVLCICHRARWRDPVRVGGTFWCRHQLRTCNSLDRFTLVLSTRMGDPASHTHRELSASLTRIPTPTMNQLFVRVIRNPQISTECCFTSTGTMRLLRAGEPRTGTSTFTQLLSSVTSVLLYVHRDHNGLLGTGSPGRPPRLSHSS